MEADLSGAQLKLANLSGADLSGANLTEADLSEADLSEADLSGANLSRSKPVQGGPEWAHLYECCFWKAQISRGRKLVDTIFGSVDLSSCIGLDSVEH